MHQDIGPPGIVVLTGAGISKESGIDTFRDKDGLWTRYSLEEVATIEAWYRDKKKVLDFYNEGLTWFGGANIRPNAAHVALAKLEAAWPGDFIVVTQNVDLLHEAAGSKNVLHMHGQAGKIRCMACDIVIDSDMELDPDTLCTRCGARGQLRPHVVWFGEIPMHMDEIHAALDCCGHFISIGTSGSVYPAAGFVEHVRRRVPRAKTTELNLEPSDGHSLFRERLYGPATRIVPAYVEQLLASVAI